MEESSKGNFAFLQFLDFVLFCSFPALAAETELKKFGQLVEGIGSLLSDGKFDLENHHDFHHLNVDASPRESLTLPQIIKSENAMMTKVVMALTSIGIEIDFCIKEAREEFLDQFLFYGENLKDGEAEAMKSIARMLPTIQKASCFVDHCSEVILNTVHQLR